jgi:hypothetical protein
MVQEQPGIDSALEHGLDVFARVLVRHFRFGNTVKNLGARINSLARVYGIGACAEPERYAKIDDEPAARFKGLLDIHRGQFCILGEKHFLPARHNGVEPVKSKPHILKIIVGESRVDYAIGIRPVKTALSGHTFIQTSLNPLQMMRE